MRPVAFIVLAALAVLATNVAPAAPATAANPTATADPPAAAATPARARPGSRPAPPYAWHAAVSVESGAFTSVACPSAHLCVATDNAGGVLTSHTPTLARTWKRADADAANALAAVACPSPAGCVAVDSVGNAVVSTQPGASSAAWKTTAVDPGNAMTALTCPTRTLCLAVDGAGNAIATTAPFAAKPTWTVTHIDKGLSYACHVDHVTGPECQPELLAVACPAASLCVATDDSGYLLVTHDPGARRPKWTMTGGGKPAGFNGITCPTSTFCALVNGYYASVVTFNPRRLHAPRTSATLEHGTAFLNGVDCPSVSVCLLESEAGGLWVSTNPTGPVTAWIRTPIRRGGVINGVACQPKWCVAVDGAGQLSVGDRRRARKRP